MQTTYYFWCQVAISGGDRVRHWNYEHKQTNHVCP